MIILSDAELDIHSGFPYPSGALSNFCNYPFEYKGEQFASTEGLLQGLKIKSIKDQRELFLMHGIEAKRKGGKNKITDGVYYFQGKPIHRLSNGYLKLVAGAYYAMAQQNPVYCKALLDTHNKVLRHTCGGQDPMKTVLTEKEFCFILTQIRKILQEKL